MNLIRIMPAEEREMDRMHHSPPTTFLPQHAGELLQSLRAEQPRVHTITNAAAQVFTANLLLAAGAVPSLTIATEEVASFTERSAALLVNLGTLDGERKKAFPLAIATARAKGLPWVLDPVFVEASPLRLAFARDLLALQPAILRCNAAEFHSLSGREPSPDSVAAFAEHYALTIALTGTTDIVTDGERRLLIGNGHPLMALTTAMGCATTALIAGFAALTGDAFEATAAALLVAGVAGEIAAESAGGPGTFPAYFLDALHSLDSATITQRAKLS